MKVVSDNKDFEQQQCRRRVEYAVRELTANLLRVARGAGKPHEVPAQALRLLEVCREFRELGYDASAAFREMLDTGPDFDAPDLQHATHTIIRGVLQITASRLLDQLTQQRNGETEFYNGISELERARAAEHARRMGRPPPTDRDR